MLMVFSIYDETDQYNIEFLENYANINLIPEVKRVAGVGDAMVMGVDYSMRIWLKPDVMAQYKLIPNDVVASCLNKTLRLLPDSSVNVVTRHSNIRYVTKVVCNKQRSLRTSLSRHLTMERYSA